MAASPDAPEPRPPDVSLLLRISASHYRVEPLHLPIAGVRGFRLHKLGSEGLAYEVVQDRDGITCSCPSRTWHPDRPCRHIQALTALDIFDAPAPPREPIRSRPPGFRLPRDEFDDD